MDRRTFFRTLGAGAAAAAAAALPRPLTGAVGLDAGVGAGAAPVIGINSHLLTPAAVAQLRDLGVTHVRTTLLWPGWKGASYPVTFAENIRRAHDAGLKLLLVVHNWPGGSPVFRSGVDRGMMRRFADFLAARAAQFPEVEAWQLWNEQDVWWQAPFGASDGIAYRERGRHYAEQLALAYPRIKAESPRALVVSGGTADHPERGHAEFLRGMMEERPPVDAVAVHAYGPWRRVRPRLEEARGIVGGQAPLWVTECGQKQDDDQAHLRLWRGLAEGNDADRLAARLYPYCLFSEESGYRLLRADERTPRPTYHWLRRRMRGV